MSPPRGAHVRRRAPGPPLVPAGQRRARSSTRSRRRASRATFFVQGRWAEAYPATAARIADRGSPGRPPLALPRADAAAPRRRLATTICATAPRAIEAATGVDPAPVVPLPVRRGRRRPAGARRARARSATATSHWHVELEDWEPWRTGEAIATDAIAGVRAHGDGAVVLLHTWPGGTGEAHRADDRRAAASWGPRSSRSTRSRSCRETCRRCSRSTAAARRPTSRSCAATARSSAPRASPARSTIAPGRRGAISRTPSSCASTPRSTRPPSAPGSIRIAVPVADVGIFCLAGADLPADDRRLLAWVRAERLGRRADPAQRHVRRAPRRHRPHRGASASSAASARTAAGVAPDGRVARFPAIGPISGDWGGGGELGGLAAWHAIRSEDGRGPKTAFQRSVPAYFGFRTARAADGGDLLRPDREERLAELAPLVFEEATGGDAVARELVDRQADEIVADGDHGDPPAADARTSTSTSCSAAASSATATLGSSPGSTTGSSRYAPEATVRRLTAPPIIGAALIGLDAAPRDGRPRAPPRARA